MKIINLKDAEAIEVVGNPLFLGGKVHTQAVIDEPYEIKKIKVTNVKFAQGARNKFHSHSKAQFLVITEGKGIVATKDKEYTVTPGMVILFPANEIHWHGATKNSSFAHLSIIGEPYETKITE